MWCRMANWRESSVLPLLIWLICVALKFHPPEISSKHSEYLMCATCKAVTYNIIKVIKYKKKSSKNFAIQTSQLLVTHCIFYLLKSVSANYHTLSTCSLFHYLTSILILNLSNYQFLSPEYHVLVFHLYHLSTTTRNTTH